MVKHPVEVFFEKVDESGKCQAWWARELGVSRQTLYNMRQTRRPMTMNMARRIAAVTDIPTEEWLKMQLDWEADNAGK